MIITGHFIPSLTLKKRRDRQSHLLLFLSLPTFVPSLAASCKGLSHKCCLLSVNFRRENRAKPTISSAFIMASFFIYLGKITLKQGFQPRRYGHSGQENVGVGGGRGLPCAL